MSVGAGPPKSFPPLAEALLPVYKLTFLCIYLPIKLPFPLPHLSLAWLVGIKYIACTLNQNNQERILSSQPCWFFVLYITIYVVWQNKKICNQIKDWKEKKRGISSIYYIYIIYNMGIEGIFLSLKMMKDDKGTTASSSRWLLVVIPCINFLLVYLETSFMCYINLGGNSLGYLEHLWKWN